jgi:hypothetical protein
MSILKLCVYSSGTTLSVVHVHIHPQLIHSERETQGDSCGQIGGFLGDQLQARILE